MPVEEPPRESGRPRHPVRRGRVARSGRGPGGHGRAPTAQRVRRRRRPRPQRGRCSPVGRTNTAGAQYDDRCVDAGAARVAGGVACRPTEHARQPVGGRSVRPHRLGAPVGQRDGRRRAELRARRRRRLLSEPTALRPPAITPPGDARVPARTRRSPVGRVRGGQQGRPRRRRRGRPATAEHGAADDRVDRPVTAASASQALKRTLEFVDAGAHSGAEVELGRCAGDSGSASQTANGGERTARADCATPTPSGTFPTARRSSWR